MVKEVIRDTGWYEGNSVRAGQRITALPTSRDRLSAAWSANSRRNTFFSGVAAMPPRRFPGPSEGATTGERSEAAKCIRPSKFASISGGIPSKFDPMTRVFAALTIAVVLAVPAFSRDSYSGVGGHRSGGVGVRSHAAPHSSGVHVRSTPRVVHTGPSRLPRRTYCATCARDRRGNIQRSRSARRQFERSHPCPSTGRRSGPCPGYVIDHVRSLKRGGADAASNMQWQTVAGAKAKDRFE